MISSKQALLARTLLNLKQEEVARALGMAHTTLSNIENGVSDPPASRLLKLQSFYEEAGIEFIEGNGVREKQNYVQRYHGVDGFRQFMDDVYETAKIFGGEICLFNSKPSMWYQWLGEDWYQMHSHRMQELGEAIRIRITVQQGEDFFILSSAEHRWFPKDRWKGNIFYAYGPKLGFLDFSNDDVRITVLNQPAFAESFRVLFDIAWEHEAILPGHTGQGEP